MGTFSHSRGKPKSSRCAETAENHWHTCAEQSAKRALRLACTVFATPPAAPYPAPPSALQTALIAAAVAGVPTMSSVSHTRGARSGGSNCLSLISRRRSTTSVCRSASRAFTCDGNGACGWACSSSSVSEAHVDLHSKPVLRGGKIGHGWQVHTQGTDGKFTPSAAAAAAHPLQMRR